MWHIIDKLPIKLAVIHIDSITVSRKPKAFKQLNQCALRSRSQYKDTLIGDIEGVKSTRRLFRALGVDPTKHRPASEALLNRALKNKPFFSVNDLVDAGNFCSLDFLLPICVYDADKIKGTVVIRKGLEKEEYPGLNSRIVNLEGRYVISDEIGSFGSPITDSFRTAVTCKTKTAILTVFASSDYGSALLREKANIFSERVRSVCGGEIKNIDILGGKVEQDK